MKFGIMIYAQAIKVDLSQSQNFIQFSEVVQYKLITWLYLW